MENVINLFDSEMPISEISKQTSIDVKTCVEYLIEHGRLHWTKGRVKYLDIAIKLYNEGFSFVELGKIFGNRKYNKFKEIICAFDEKSSNEIGLIAGKPEMAISSEASLEERSETIPEMEVESSDSKYPTLNE